MSLIQHYVILDLWSIILDLYSITKIIKKIC